MKKEAYARPFRKVYQVTSYKFLHLSTFEEIEHRYSSRFLKYNFKQPPAFTNYDNHEYILVDHNYGIQFYQRLKNNFPKLVIFKIKIKEKHLSTDYEVDMF